MDTLKPFVITIRGLYCPVKHPRRIIEYVISEDDGKITDTDVLIILHETLCFFKREMIVDIPVNQRNEFVQKTALALKRFLTEEGAGDSLKYFELIIKGNFSEKRHPERSIQIKDTKALNDIELFIVLYEGFCRLRNILSKSIGRKQLTKIAHKHNIYNFGMRKDEQPFETRD